MINNKKSKNADRVQVISGVHNPRIKRLEKLGSKKYRQEYGQYMVENLTIIVDALKAGYDFEALYFTEDFAAKQAKKLSYLQNRSVARNFYLIGPKLNKAYSGLDTPSGITAVYNIKEKQPDNSSVIYLNGINDPGNLGTILRSALAFDFVNLVLDKNCVDVYNPKVVNAAKDAIFKLNIIEDRSGEWIRNCRLPIYTTSSHVGIGLSEFTPEKLFCLVMGSESHGVSPGLSELSKASIKIEISARIESLNVATATAILLYELKRKTIDQN